MSSFKSNSSQLTEAGHARAAAPTSLTDPLAEVRALKRWVAIGVYAAILGTEPFYFFVLHYNWPQLLSGLVAGNIIAFTAIEGVYGAGYRYVRLDP